MTPQTPFFTHDCKACTYLGSATVLEEKIDFYFHLAHGKPASEASLIYRTGDEGRDYGSTTANYVSPLSYKAMLALGLYVKYLGANGASGFVEGSFSKDCKMVLKLD